ncbi:3-deoxy-D-manno-octulosonic acid transferase [Litoreibacter arenae]|uniref:3-deoxy-D-manno-octulosonic acid transferase n=1 Tax=Litoreibacter arenae DSM 19593 TaxID=1123360 RepID=S9RI64_9RHOB|nr:glycosyltransferase N-terminal domain-containing protein [Litoreibacter arenae]EPX77790.1 3-deoxy-D-manno-octulosonic-acid transferase [Litoreibacter arenae DSM 19593]
MAFSPILALYLNASGWTVPLANRKLASRLADGKEDPARIEERRGIASCPRPRGELIWFHAASVGESLSLLDLIESLIDERPDLNVLITTGTRSSAELLAKRLPDQTIHQFVPLDTVPFVRSFLDHWKPDVAIWTESELWPALISETCERGIPMISLNTRMSRDSFKKWLWLRGTAGALLNKFDLFLTQDRITAKHLVRLGAPSKRVRVNGSLKESSGALPHDEAARATISAALETRPVWLAASTHPGEDEIVAEAQRIARRAAPRLLLIIAPRHPERGPAIAEMLRSEGWRVALRSEGAEPDAVIDIYLADTLGEMGLWYRIAPLCFVGGSLVEIGGHNPYEPAALGSAIIHGPHVANAKDVYDRLDEVGGAKQVTDARTLGDAVIDLLEPHRSAEMAHAAWEISSQGAQAAEAASVEIIAALDRAAEKS